MDIQLFLFIYNVDMMELHKMHVRLCIAHVDHVMQNHAQTDINYI